MNRATIEHVKKTLVSENRNATSYDVARALGVSQSAVSRALSAHGSSSPAMRARIRDAAQALGYTPNGIARSLITRRSNVVAVLITEQTTRYTPEVLFHLNVELQRHGLHLLLFTAHEAHALEDLIAQVLTNQVDGIISCTTLSAAHVALCAGRQVPVVMFNRKAPNRLASSVSCDHAAASHRLATQLLDAGKRRFAYVAGPDRAPVSLLREQGFIAALKARGLTPVRRQGDYSYASGATAMQEIWAERTRVQVVACANDGMALGALDAARFELQLRVPQDIAIVGFDDITEAARPSYALTTARQPIETLARKAVDVLRRRFESPSLPSENILLEAQIVVRSSAILTERPQ